MNTTTLIRALCCALIAACALHAQDATAPADPFAGPTGALADPFAGQPPEKIASLKTLKGKEYKEVIITKVSADELRFIHATGTAAVPYADLSAADREKYMLNSLRSSRQTIAEMNKSLDKLRKINASLDRQLGIKPEEEKAESKAPDPQAAYWARIAAEKQKIAERDRDYAKREELRARIAKSGVNVRVRLSQVLPDKGIALGYGSAIRKATLTDYELKPGKIVNGAILEPEDKEPICIVGLPATFVDGDSWAGWLYPCGSYSYTTVSTAAKTVRKYGASAAAAEIELSK